MNIIRTRKTDHIILEKPKKLASYSLNMASGFTALADELILLATGSAIYAYQISWNGAPHWLYILAIITLSITVVFSFNQAHLYEVSSIRKQWGQFHKVFGILAITFLTFLAIAFAFKVSEEFSRLWVFSWFVSSVSLIFLARIFCCRMLLRLSRKGQLSRKIVILGTGEQGKRLLNQLQRAEEPWVNIVGFFDDRSREVTSSFMQYPVLGNLENLLDYVRKHRVDDIIIALPWNADKRINEIVGKLGDLPVHVRLSSDLAGFSQLGASYSSIGSVPMLDMVKKPLDGWWYALKVTHDTILSLLILIGISPLMVIIALAIKLESEGPVVFRQNRKGFNGKNFSVFKFRTMHHNRPLDIGSAQAKKNDPRVTTVGKFLRRTSMDELPQLLNVLNGSMSLVGPRPHPNALDDEFCKVIGSYLARHRVKPGITGWAQVNGLRGETDTPEKMKARVEYDIYYIDNWSFLFDAKILLLTIPAILNKNAY